MSEHENHDAHGHGHAHAGPHVLPLSLYLTVFGILLFLTVVTVWVSTLDLGKHGLGTLAIAIALFVASIKAALVAGYFMHLKYDDRFNSIVFFGSLVFMSLFFMFVFADLGARNLMVPQHANGLLEATEGEFPAPGKAPAHAAEGGHGGEAKGAEAPPAGTAPAH